MLCFFVAIIIIRVFCWETETEEKSHLFTKVKHVKCEPHTPLFCVSFSKALSLSLKHFFNPFSHSERMIMCLMQYIWICIHFCRQDRLDGYIWTIILCSFSFSKSLKRDMGVLHFSRSLSPSLPVSLRERESC